MALVVEADRLELVRLGMIGFRPNGTIRSIPYAEIAGVDTKEKLFEIRIRASELRPATTSGSTPASAASAQDGR